MGKTQFGMTIRKLLSIARDWRRHKTVYENSEINYNWFGNVIRETDSRGMKREYMEFDTSIIPEI